MLIQALCNYYDILSADGKVIAEGYSNVKVHYLVSLTEEGEIDEIIDNQETVQVPSGKNKTKEKRMPKDEVMPLRTEKSGIDANIIEHRPLYLFGLNLEKDIFTPEDRTDKAKKSHETFVKTNLEFTEGLDSPVVKAYRNFILNWKPEEQTENKFLLGLGKKYGTSGFAFCLSGSPDTTLHKDIQVKEKWEIFYKNKQAEGEDKYISQCAVTGEEGPIARIHSKIKGVYGGLSTGSVLVGFNNSSENSYGNEQSYNSNISEKVMKKYTEALNFLLRDNKHKISMDETTIIFWALNTQDVYEDAFTKMLFGSSDKMGADQTEEMLRAMFKDSRNMAVMGNRLDSLGMIDENVDFYILGLKPNSSRLSMKFLYKRKFADVLWNIARFQKEVQLSEKIHPVYLSSVKRELISPKSSNENVNPALMARLLEAIIYGTNYPVELMDTLVRRVKTDSGCEDITFARNRVRVGLIKAYINRNSAKEELTMGLDRENDNQAYICGRLFAILEKLQQDASGGSLNRTIKDAYFASAASKPTLVFPKLVMLAQNHLKKVEYPVYYNKLIGETIERLKGQFPERLDLKDQGRFIVGYYQQNQSFYNSDTTVNKHKM